ncbi:MAG: ankyrin repeat domain-containing protein [Bacteroidia bacterium]
MRYLRTIFMVGGLFMALNVLATTHRGTTSLSDWTPSSGENGPELESLTVKWTFSDSKGDPEQLFFMQWYLGRDYYYDGKRIAITELGRSIDRLSFSTLVLEADLYADDRKVSTLRFDMGATPPHGGNWGTEVQYEWSLRKMFPRLSAGEAADAFEIAELEIKNLRIREVVFGGERQVIASVDMSKGVASEQRETSRYSDPEPTTPATTTSPNIEFGSEWETSSEDPRPEYSARNEANAGEYNGLIAKGDAAMEVYDFDGAKSYYEEARTVSPRRSVANDKLEELEKILGQRDAYAALVQVLKQGYQRDLMEADREKEAALKLALEATDENAEGCAFERFQWYDCRATELGERLRKTSLEARLRIYEPEKAPSATLNCAEVPCKADAANAPIQRNPNYVSLVNRKYKLYEMSKEEAFLRRSQELLGKAQEEDPENADVWVMTARFVDSPVEALPYLNKALSIEPKNQAALSLRNDLQDKLLESIESEIAEGKSTLLKESISKNLINASTEINGKSLMATAIEGEQISLITELLATTANTRSADGGPAQVWLFEAARLNKPKSAATLIARGARFDIEDQENETPLLTATRSGSKEVLRLFLKDADKSVDVSEAMLIAYRDGELELLELFIASGAKADPRDDMGNTLLMKAIEENDQKIVDLMLRSGAEVNDTNGEGATALAIAGNKQDAEITNLLFREGADPEQALKYLSAEANDDANWLAGQLFTYALENELNEQVQMSLRYDPELPLRQHPNGGSYLTYALKNNRWELAVAMLESAQLPIDRPIDGENILFSAVEASAVPVVAALMKQDAIDLNQTNANGYSALHLAVDQRSIELVEALAEGGHPLEATDPRGNTPLHRALEAGQNKIAEYLSGVNHVYTELNRRGQHPIHQAIREGQDQVVENLIANGTDVNILGESGMAPLHYAAEEIDYDIARALVEAGADMGIKDSFGRTPYKISRDRGADERMKELLKPDLRDRIPAVNMPDVKMPDVKLPKIFRRGGGDESSADDNGGDESEEDDNNE